MSGMLCRAIVSLAAVTLLACGSSSESLPPPPYPATLPPVGGAEPADTRGASEPGVKTADVSFGAARLGAEAASFPGVDPQQEGILEMQDPSAKVYEGQPLTSVAYVFSRKRLFNVSFGARGERTCSAILAKMKIAYGTKPPAETTESTDEEGHAVSHFRGVGYAARFVHAGDTCSGALWVKR